MPQGLHHLREEAGLAGVTWQEFGKNWQLLAALWLRVEVLLAKTGRVDLEIKEICASTLPTALQDWLYSRILCTDSNRPMKDIHRVYTAVTMGYDDSR